MDFFRHPAPFRQGDGLLARQADSFGLFGSGGLQHQTASSWIGIESHKPLPPHASHPDLPHLAMLIFEAVLEVVCVSLPGYIVARQGLFTAEMQKFTANLNVALFTPCLIFVKLASQLSADKLADLAIIPVIFIVQTLISFGCAYTVSKAFGFARRPRNFVIAMGVFGNSNSLPISLVLSLSKTIKGLHWDKVPNDNDDEVAARGILYLLIFQQLGQLVRWSWGYNVLLAPANQVEGTEDRAISHMEEGDREESQQPLLVDFESDEDRVLQRSQANSESDDTKVEDVNDTKGAPRNRSHMNAEESFSGAQTPVAYQERPDADDSSVTSASKLPKSLHIPKTLSTPTNGNMQPSMGTQVTPSLSNEGRDEEVEESTVQKGIRQYTARLRGAIRGGASKVWNSIAAFFHSLFAKLPQVLQTILGKSWYRLKRFGGGVWDFMNPPLWAMLAAILVASIPKLQALFFTPGTFVRNSVTRAIESNAGVAIPLILVVLGGNLAGNTLPKEAYDDEESKIETKLLVASIISRMLLPFALLAPLLALTAKFLQISILDDPIFVIVCFLISGAPSALQLAQICQINNVYMGAMSRLLFQSYVVWILPSTLILVMTALEVVEWAQR